MILALVLLTLSSLVSVIGLSISARGQAEKVILFFIASMLSTAAACTSFFIALDKNVQIDTLASAFFSAFALYSIYILIDSLRDI